MLITKIGVSPVSEKYEIIMATHICEQLHKHLAKSIPQVIPPSLSDLIPEQYEIIETKEVKNEKELKNFLQKAKKRNKQIEKLKQAKTEAQLAKQLLQRRQYVFISIDIEAYELDHSILTEVGWSIYDPKTNRFLDQHYINEAYTHLRNGQYVDDERDNFIFGTSVCCSLKQAFTELKKDLLWAKERDGGFVLVGHGLEHDLNYLRQHKFQWPSVNGKDETLDLEKAAKIAIVNTDVLYGASVNDLHNPPSLGNTLGLLNIDTWHLHNAGEMNNIIQTFLKIHSFLLLGNDAHYTLLLLLKLTNVL